MPKRGVVSHFVKILAPGSAPYVWIWACNICTDSGDPNKCFQVVKHQIRANDFFRVPKIKTLKAPGSAPYAWIWACNICKDSGHLAECSQVAKYQIGEHDFFRVWLNKPVLSGTHSGVNGSTP